MTKCTCAFPCGGTTPNCPSDPGRGQRKMTDIRIEDALRKAFQLGQTFWQQADSESHRQNQKSYETEAKFEALVKDMTGK